MRSMASKVCTLLLLIVCTRVSSGQVNKGGLSGLPPAPPPSNDAASSSSPATECKIGDLIPGPTCDSFYMCVGRLYASKKVKFQCAPGTVFDDELNTCVHGIGSKCLEGFSFPTSSTSPSSPDIPGEAVSTPSPPESTVAGGTCSSYKLDPTTVYECPEPGYFPSLTDCSRFYRCIATMNCIMKGYMFRCPADYQYVSSQNKCLTKEEAGTCNRLADAAGQTHIVTSVVDLTPDVLDDFYRADVYWDMMPFLPSEPQKVVAVGPSALARESDRGFFMRGL